MVTRCGRHPKERREKREREREGERDVVKRGERREGRERTKALRPAVITAMNQRFDRL